MHEKCLKGKVKHYDIQKVYIPEIEVQLLNIFKWTTELINDDVWNASHFVDFPLL